MKQMLLVASLAVAVAVAVLATLLVVTSSQGVLAQGTRGQEGPRSVPKTANPPDEGADSVAEGTRTHALLGLLPKGKRQHRLVERMRRHAVPRPSKVRPSA